MIAGPQHRRLFATGGDRDPMQFYKSYINHRPADSMTPDCPFYLTVIPTNRLKDSSNVWFYNKPMGVNYLASLMSMAAKESGIDTTRKTNHSVRKTCTRTLRRNHIAPHKAIQITGHKNPLTLLQYDGELSDDEHQEYCRYLTSSSQMSTSTETVRSTNGNRGASQHHEASSTLTATDSTVAISCSQSSAPSTLQPSLPAPTLTHMFGQGSVLKNCSINITVGSRSFETPPRKYKRVLPIESSSDSSQ